MKGLVLAAGQAQRLRPLTADLPKTLLPVAGDRTILDLTLANLRAVGIGRVTKIELPEADLGETDARAAYSGEHQIYRHGEWITAGLYERAKLKPGMAVEGPAIITELDSTTVVLPNHVASVDRHFNLLITRG